MFLSRAILNVLPTWLNLMRRSVGDTIACIHCSSQYEDDKHILFDVILQSKFGISYLLGTNGEELQWSVSRTCCILSFCKLENKKLQFFHARGWFGMHATSLSGKVHPKRICFSHPKSCAKWVFLTPNYVWIYVSKMIITWAVDIQLRWFLFLWNSKRKGYYFHEDYKS